MQLHTIGSSNKKAKRRVGRGGKRGTTSGRGTKGQKSRSGHRMRPAVRDLILRLPKRRGYKNRPQSEKPFIVSLSELETKLKLFSGEKKVLEVNKNFLKELGILPTSHSGVVKILNGKIEMAVFVKGIKLSKSAKEKIEKAGGSVIADPSDINPNKNRKKSAKVSVKSE